jgi:phosphoserine phosphatase
MEADYVITIFGPNVSELPISRAREFAGHEGLGIAGEEIHADVAKLQCSGALVADIRARLIALEDELRCDINIQPVAEWKKRRKLFVFDMDSTLIEAEVIDELAKLAGVGDQVAAITAAAMRGELDFKQSFTKRLGLLRGLSEESVRALIERIPLTPGAESLFRRLRERGVRTAIASGGFSFVGAVLQQRLGINHVHTNELHIVDGQVTGQVVGRVVDADRKAELLRQVAQEEGIPLDEVVAVGDGANDRAMLAIAGRGVAFHAKPVLRESADLRITYTGLDSLLDLVTI